jgi:hypothetical protein
MTVSRESLWNESDDTTAEFCDEGIPEVVETSSVTVLDSFGAV